MRHPDKVLICRHRLAVVGLMLALPMGAFAASTSTIAPHPAQHSRLQARELPDSVLAKMRGRYVDGTRIIAFGVAMVSQWTTPAGKQYTAAANLGMTLNGASKPTHVGFKPSLSVQQVAAAANPAAVPTGTHSISGGGIHNAHGVVQGIQVAGDNNGVTNDTHISVGSQPLKDLPSGLSSAQTIHSHGATLTSKLGKSGVGISINLPGLGQALQRIKGGSGLTQLAQTTASLQQIHNVTQISIQVGAMKKPLTSGNLGQSLQLLRFNPSRH